VGCGLGGSVNLRMMERHVEFGCEFLGEGQIGIGFIAAQAVMEMGGMEDQPQFPAPFREGAQEGDRIRAA
jgi:hypothetical protein